MSTPDTLFYKGFFARDSLLRQDSLLFGNGSERLMDMQDPSAALTPESLSRSDAVTIALLVCLLLLLAIIRHSRKQLGARIQNFMFPSKDVKTVMKMTDDNHKEAVRFLLALLASLMMALLFYSYAQTRWNVDLMPVTSLQLIAIYTGTALSIVLLKHLLYLIVHTTFFTYASRLLWREDYTLLFALESILLFPLGLMAVYLDLSPEMAAYLFIGLLLFVKILLFSKTFSTFFGKIHGTLHLFVYFCALEAAPLVLLWSTLVEITTRLTTFF